MPGTPMVAVFDTAFHQTMPEKKHYMYGLPYEYYEKYKVRRYGFHGTSHSFVSKKGAEVMEKAYDEVKTIVCHLGNGASVSAVLNGKSVDTSMGLTLLRDWLWVPVQEILIRRSWNLLHRRKILISKAS